MEIDTEVVELLKENATAYADLTWSRTLPIGVSKRDHYDGFSEILALGSQHIYDATKKFAGNYVLIASAILPIFTLMSGFEAAPLTNVNGPYFAG